MIRPFLIVSAAVAFFFINNTNAIGDQPQINIQSGVQLSWSTINNDNYQLQWSSNPSSVWTDLGGLVAGDGTTNSLYDPAPSGARSYQVLQIVPGSAPVSTIPLNGGFEFGNGTIASNWSVDTAAGGPVYAVRTNNNAHSGSFNFEVYLASTGTGPVVQFNQAGVPVTGGTTYPFTFYADALAGSVGEVAQWKVVWNSGGDTDYQTFTPGNNTYTFVSNSVTAPVGATLATIYFHFAGAADMSQSATIDIDDVAFNSGSGPGSPDVTNVLSAASQLVANITWLATIGTQYQPETTTNLTAGTWDTNFPIVVGDGDVKSMFFPMTNSPLFFRLYIPPVIILPPSNLQQIESGIINAIGLDWAASSTPGVIGYRILYGTDSESLTNSDDVGNVNSAIISNLTPGQTYYVAVITLTANGQSPSASNILTAQPDTTVGVVPLFDASTPLEPDTISNTPTALITWIADRPRGRHARENGPSFSIYDTYLPFYWEQRVTTIEIIDTIGKGGTGITFNFWALTALDTPNIRFFFQGQTTVAQYGENLYATSVDPDTLTNWTTTITMNGNLNRPLQVGDRIEFEFSPFMVAPTNGQDNYYGGAILYIAGQGIVPWQTSATNIDLN
ncbi:MAG: fibronectin type III domain-containing protein, partial [Limisphaerales bacterium]